ncbi:MAG TPA: hypothetical protein VEI02_13335 [Planctomycetota bacterium]|nr:hypothetical protein [Planctomycetota bacterium]
MALPLAVLGVLAVVSAGVGWPSWPGSHWFEDRVNDRTLVKNLMTGSSTATEATRRVFEGQYVHDLQAHGAVAAGAPEIAKHYGHAWHDAHGFVLVFSLIVTPSAILLAYFFFMKRRGVDYVSKNGALRGIRTALENLWYVDAAIMRGLVPASKRLFAASFAFDKAVVDGVVNATGFCTTLIAKASGKIDYHGVDGAVRGAGAAVLEGGTAARRLVTGKINDYVMFTVLGLVALGAAVLIFAR